MFFCCRDRPEILVRRSDPCSPFPVATISAFLPTVLTLPRVSRVQMQEMYRTVRRTKKLPAIVEEIGRRTFADDGLPPQRQVRVHVLNFLTGRFQNCVSSLDCLFLDGDTWQAQAVLDVLTDQ